MRIFVSYRSLDRQIVSPLVTDLIDMGYETWYDQELEGGQTWWNNILENIRRSDLLVFALTQNSLDSYPCQLEYTYANALRRNILPVQLSEGINIALLPVVLQERQIVRYIPNDLESYKRLQVAIRKLPPVADLPTPLPEPPPIPISPLAPIREVIDSPSLTYEQQAALVHHLKGYIGHQEYGSGARELLQRLSQHPTLLASVLREIEAILTGPTPAVVTLPQKVEEPIWSGLFKAPSGGGDKSEKPEPKEAAPAFVPDADERVLRELSVSFIGGSILGMAAGYFTGGLATIATAAARKALERRMVITDRRIVFLPNATDQEAITIPFDQIAEIKKTLKVTDPAIDIKTKAGDAHRFTLVAAAGVGFGNRDEIIALINQFLPKGKG
jgi:hypothetical protein